ncbi:TetR/AcrR family transcriptional regulator [Streptomyces sp. SID3343]|uniref:TetR/AcrR family transcriptional regulator n=1 Tax=Streptomyces sp. SID3343 TaxID=2690260 RepID=UPI00136ABED1|nr:TetR/AcrR family transcriptional regulator [Streptomyces sp. SID3343]MYW02480.1 TetR family transcriptional regulator [Streptomyces sp. SID3343]
MTETDGAEGLRELKKRRMKTHISDVATGLFLEHGFAPVTVARIAEVAEVSVNTVYNYFPTKEDLFFDREDEIVDRLARIVREREVGESATVAILGSLRRDIEARSAHVGLVEGYGRFMDVMHSSPALMARLWRMQQRGADALAATLAEEAGADPNDPVPELIAGQLAGIQQAVFRAIGRGIVAGHTVEDAARRALRQLDAIEPLLSQAVLEYAIRPQI